MDNMALSSATLKPEEPEDDEVQIPYLPWLGITHCSWNCSHYPKVAKVLVNLENNDICSSATNDESSESGSDDSPEQHDQLATAMEESTNDVLYSEIFKSKECTFHDDFQIGLNECQRKRARNEEIDLRTHFYQINVRNENVIVVQAFFDNKWQLLGYVPKEKFPEVIRAIQAEEVQDVKLENVFQNFICDLKQYR